MRCADGVWLGESCVGVRYRGDGKCQGAVWCSLNAGLAAWSGIRHVV